MRKLILLLSTIFVMGYIFPILSQANFSTSLHALRGGKPYFYNKVENGGTVGFETLTNVSIAGLGCVQCHDATDANGVAYPSPYVPGCADCHATNTAPFPGPVTQTDCLGCHGREAAVINLGLADVHRTAGKTCMFCHKDNDMHGNGTTYNSMFESGAITADCSNTGCHEGHIHTNPSVDPHAGKLHCTSCHSSTNLACYNCHFETVVATSNHLRRAQRQIKDFVFLVNRTKDNKVHTASFQSLSYQGQTWVTIGPSSAHTIVKTGARTCVDCHQNFGGNIPAITDYNADGIMKFGTWNTSDSTLSWTKGIIPIPSDWLRSFKLDYITYNGNTSDPLVLSKNWSLIDDVTDGSHMLYATPLTNSQMAKIGMDTSWTVVPVELTSFKGNVNGSDIKLDWSTETELNNNGFEIQRKTSKEFVTVGFVTGNGTSTIKHDYSFTDKQLQHGIYAYRLKQIDYNGKFDYSPIVEVQVVQGLNYSLMQNYPNPFNPETAIKYSIPQNGRVTVKIFNVTGNEIMTLVDKEMLAGSHEVKWNGKDNTGATVTSGVYFVKLSSGTYVETKKMMFLK
jgi:hypothetical protein